MISLYQVLHCQSQLGRDQKTRCPSNNRKPNRNSYLNLLFFLKKRYFKRLRFYWGDSFYLPGLWPIWCSMWAVIDWSQQGPNQQLDLLQSPIQNNKYERYLLRCPSRGLTQPGRLYRLGIISKIVFMCNPQNSVKLITNKIINIFVTP